MPINVARHSEPIPGYKLLERLGEGGFGEVWKAEAPGGVLKAVKIIHGCLEGDGDEQARLHQELKALNRVRTVRHPYVLSLERFDIVDGRLIIVTELADRSLWDRFEECRDQGLPGIPRDELLRYMEEAAEALDVMNAQYDLQHLDIKPQNLFLLYNHVKVGDFGLVKDLEGMTARATSGVTAVYAAPETFGGVVSRFCDQYNLAVAYQELLTGRLPFEGNNSRQLMMQHVMGEPNLRPLPPGDRRAVARALAKKPEDRHPSCLAFVQALRGAAERVVPGGSSHGDSARTRTPLPPNDPARQTPATEMLGPPNGVPQVILDAALDEPADVPIRSSPPATPARETVPPPAATATVPKAVVPPKPPPEKPVTTGPGILFPAVVIGAGGLGGRVLRQLRKALRKRAPTETWPHLRLLQLDTDPAAAEPAAPEDPDAVLSPDEVLVTRFHRPSHYLKRQKERQELEQWLPLTSLMRLPREQQTAGGWRALGRLAFVSGYPAVAARLREELEACAAADALTGVDRRTGLGLRTTCPRVYLVAGLGGGTGSGMFLDLAYAVRRQLRQSGHPGAEVVAVLLLPAAERTAEAARGVANAFAALTEMKYFSTQGVSYFGGYSGAEGSGSTPPFSRCVLLQLPAAADGKAAIQELTAQAGDFLCRDLTGTLGRAADEARAALGLTAVPLPCQTFGAYSFSVPRRPLLQRVAHNLCRRVVRGWQVESSDALAGKVKAWVTDQVTRWELEPQVLAKRLNDACAPILGEAPDAFCAAAAARWARGGEEDLYRHRNAAAGALKRLQEAVAPPRRGGTVNPRDRLTQAVQEAGRTLAEEAEKQLAEVALGALVEPRFRLIGAEDAVQRQIHVALGELARKQNDLAEARGREADEIAGRLRPLLDTLLNGSFLSWRRKTRAAESLAELLREYAAVSREGAVLQELGRIYQVLQANLNRYLLTVGCCHEQIGRFLKSFGDLSRADEAPQDLGLGRYLLPAGARTLGEAVDRVLGSLMPEEEQALHERVHGLIGEALRTHVHLCTAPPAHFKELREAIDREVATLAETSLGRAHAAALYVEQHAQDAEVSADLAGAFEEARPELATSGRPSREELCVLAVPPGPEGDQFKALVKMALPDTPMHDAASADDIVFYREQPRVVLTDLPQLGPAAREVYQQVLASDQPSPHSRGDIVAWQPGEAG